MAGLAFLDELEWPLPKTCFPAAARTFDPQLRLCSAQRRMYQPPLFLGYSKIPEMINQFSHLFRFEVDFKGPFNGEVRVEGVPTQGTYSACIWLEGPWLLCKLHRKQLSSLSKLEVVAGLGWRMDIHCSSVPHALPWTLHLIVPQHRTNQKAHPRRGSRLAVAHLYWHLL